MKKLIAFILISSCIALTAQNYTTQKLSTAFTAKANETIRDVLYQNEITTTSSIVMSREADEDHFIGNTKWPKQTNGVWHNRIFSLANGKVSLTWPTGNTSNERGTAYNFYDGLNWAGSVSTTNRIETTRAGYGVNALLGNGGEIVVSHNGSSGLIINKRAVAGTGNWVESILLGPSITPTGGGAPSTGLYWPAIATCGDTVHLLAITESDEGYLYNGIQNCLVYYRSTNNGNTWDIQHHIISGLSASEMPSYSADCYEIVAKPGCVAVVYGRSFCDMFLFKSANGGNTWNTSLIFDNPIPNNLNFNTEYFDTTFVPTNDFTVALDENNKAHVMFGILRCVRSIDNEPGYYSYWRGLYQNQIYWNENLPPLGNSRTSLNPDVAEANGVQVFKWVDMLYLNFDSINRFNWNAPDYKTHGHVIQPKLFCENGKVYAFYTSVPYPFCEDKDNAGFLHGIFATVSDDGGHTWDQYHKSSLLSYTPSLSQYDWQITNLLLNGGASKIDAMKGSYIGSAIKENAYCGVTSIGDNFMVYWLTDDNSGIEETFPITTDPYKLYYMTVPKSQIGIFRAVDEINTGIWNYGVSVTENTLSNATVYPNPANTQITATVSSLESTTGVISLTNMLGQTVYQNNISLSTGNNKFNIDVNNYNSGVYIINIKTSKGMSSQKVVIR